MDIAKNKTDAEIKTQIIRQEMAYVSGFLDRGTEANIENRYRFTQYLAALTQDEGYRKGWRQLHDEAAAARKEATEKLRHEVATVETKTGEAARDAEAEIARLKAELTRDTTSKAFIWPTEIQYETIINKAPCPSGATLRLYAFEDPSLSPPPSSSLPPTSLPSPFSVALRLFARSGGGKKLAIGRFCVDKDNKSIGEAVAFDSGGERIELSKVVERWPWLSLWLRDPPH